LLIQSKLKAENAFDTARFFLSGGNCRHLQSYAYNALLSNVIKNEARAEQE